MRKTISIDVRGKAKESYDFLKSLGGYYEDYLGKGKALELMTVLTEGYWIGCSSLSTPCGDLVEVLPLWVYSHGNNYKKKEDS